MLKAFNDNNLIHKNIDKKGVIFFLQKWTELTYLKTIDTYQYTIMNSVVSLKECYHIIEKTIDGTYPTLDNLNDCRKELNRLLKDDAIIKKYNKNLYGNLLNLANMKVEAKDDSQKNANLRRLQSRLKYSIKILDSSFKQWITDDITQAVTIDDEESIDCLSNILVSQCVYEGWSIKGLHNLHRYFFFKDEEDLEVFKRFVNILNNGNSLFHVYIKIEKTKSISELIEWASYFNISIKCGSEVIKSYEAETKRFLNLELDADYFVIDVSAKDSYSAALEATEKSKKMMEMLTFYDKIEAWSPHGTKLYAVSSDGYVQPMSFSDVYGTHLYIESSNSVFDRTLNLFTMDANNFDVIQTKLQSVYSYVNISKLAMYQEEKFLNLWIGLEAFMNTGQYGNIIAHVKNVLPSVMSRRYVYRIIRNLCEDFLRCSIKLELNGNVIDLECYDKQAVVERIILALKTEDEFLEMIEFAKVNTLLVYRLKSIRKLIISSEETYKKIMKYSDTIEWHVQRLYRLRNDITHSGYLSKHDITPYIEHLHEFIAVLIIEVIYVVSSEQLTSIGDVLAYLSDTFEAYKREYEPYKKDFEENNKVGITGVIEMN